MSNDEKESKKVKTRFVKKEGKVITNVEVNYNNNKDILKLAIKKVIQKDNK